MIIIRSNKILDLFSKTTKGVNLIFVIFVRDLKDKETIKHEMTHACQLIELLIIPYIIIYYAHYIYNLKIKYKHVKNIKIRKHAAYMNIIFEKEAFGNEDNPKLRFPFFYNWIKYV